MSLPFSISKKSSKEDLPYCEARPYKAYKGDILFHRWNDPDIKQKLQRCYRSTDKNVFNMILYKDNKNILTIDVDELGVKGGKTEFAKELQEYFDGSNTENMSYSYDLIEYYTLSGERRDERAGHEKKPLYRM